MCVCLAAGWPIPPSHQPWCGRCPAGWASTTVNVAACEMCSPGSFATWVQSPRCTLCANGTYAASWGSTHCNHCIIGTYAPSPVRPFACILVFHYCWLTKADHDTAGLGGILPACWQHTNYLMYFRLVPNSKLRNSTPMAWVMVGNAQP